MQESSSIPHGLTNILWYAVVTFLASIFGGGTLATILALILNRNKTKSEICETDARAMKLLAEVRSMDAQTDIMAGNAVLRLINKLAFAEARKRECEAEAERLANENAAYEKQIRWAKAMFQLKGIPWDDNPS